MRRYYLLVGLLFVLCLPFVAAPQGVVNVKRISAASSPSPTPTPFDISFNFRSTCGFVTDGPGQQCVRKTDLYPTANTINGITVTYGWIIDNNMVLDVDRNNTNDSRVAGINYVAGAGSSTPLGNTYFRTDLLSAGSYAIHLAIGDSFAQINQYAEIRDTTSATTPAFIVSASSTSANHYLDANGVDLTNVTWPTNETGKTVSFGTTQVRLYPGSLTASDVTTIAHLRIVRIS